MFIEQHTAHFHQPRRGCMYLSRLRMSPCSHNKHIIPSGFLPAQVTHETASLEMYSFIAHAQNLAERGIFPVSKIWYRIVNANLYLSVYKDESRRQKGLTDSSFQDAILP